MHNAMKVYLKLFLALLCEGGPRLTEGCIFEECSSVYFLVLEDFRNSSNIRNFLFVVINFKC